MRPRYYGPTRERPDAGAEYVLVGEGRKRELTTRKGRAKGRKGAGRIQPAESRRLSFAAN